MTQQEEIAVFDKAILDSVFDLYETTHEELDKVRTLTCLPWDDTYFDLVGISHFLDACFDLNTNYLW